VIRAAAEDGDGAIDLLGQHGAGQSVRPGLRTEGQHFMCAITDRGIVAIGRADQEHQLALAAVPQLADMLGEGAAGPGLAALVAGDDPGALEMRFELALGLVDLDDLDRAEPQGAARGASLPSGVAESLPSTSRTIFTP